MPEQTPTLRDMIRAELDRGVTYAVLAERTVDPTTGRRRISGAQLNRIVRGQDTPMPTEDQLNGIAAAIRRPYEQVRQAAIAQWLPPRDEQSTSRDAQVRAEIAELRAEALRLTARAEELGRRAARDPERESA